MNADKHWLMKPRSTKHEARSTKCFRLLCFLCLLCLLCFLSLSAAPQDTGSMASKVTRPAGCSDGQILKYVTGTGQYECQNESGGSGLPAGAIVLIVSGSCPSGFVEETSLNGKIALGTVAANADIGSTGGSDNITPAGTVSQPTFTGDALANHSHDYSQVINHTHTVNVTDPGHTHVETKNSATTGSLSGFGVDTSTSTQVASGYSTESATTGITASTANPSGGVATGTTVAVSAGTPAGTVSQPTFTGTQFDNRPAFVRVIFCRKS